MEQNKERFNHEIGKVTIRKTNNKKIKNTKTINTKYDNEDIFTLIAKAELDLIAIDTSDIIVSTTTNSDGDVTTSKYEGVTATFCKLHWAKYKNDPPSLPMFRMLVEESECDSSDNRYTMDLADIARKLDEHEAEYEEKYGVHVMPPAGFIFHESRVGSTLVSNSLTAMDPAAHRVYSESDPINQAFGACKSFTLCDMETNVDLLRDVVYLLGRTSVPTEKRMFFKVSSAFTTRIDVMQAAFEYVPWLFVFRNPVQTMMSHIDPTKLKTFRGASYPAVCLRSKRHPSEELQSLVLDKYDPKRHASELSDVEFCAAHLVRERHWSFLFMCAYYSYLQAFMHNFSSKATLCEAALFRLKREEHRQGAAVEYENLVDKLITDVFPNHFTIGEEGGLDEITRQRILDVAKVYSKSKDHDRNWKEDSAKKDASATPEIVEASDRYLSSSYAALRKTFCVYNRAWHYVYFAD